MCKYIRVVLTATTSRLVLAPGDDPLWSDADDRRIIRKHSRCVLGIFRSQPANRLGALLLCRVRNQLRLSANQDVPEASPVVVVLVNKEGNLCHCPDVSQSREPFGYNTFRFPV